MKRPTFDKEVGGAGHRTGSVDRELKETEEMRDHADRFTLDGAQPAT